MYPFKQFSRVLGSATLIDAPSTDTVGIYLLEKEEGIEKKKKIKKASSVSLTGVRVTEYKAAKLKQYLRMTAWNFSANVLFCEKL